MPRQVSEYFAEGEDAKKVREKLGALPDDCTASLDMIRIKSSQLGECCISNVSCEGAVVVLVNYTNENRTDITLGSKNWRIIDLAKSRLELVTGVELIESPLNLLANLK